MSQTITTPARISSPVGCYFTDELPCFSNTPVFVHAEGVTEESVKRDIEALKDILSRFDLEYLGIKRELPDEFTLHNIALWFNENFTSRITSISFANVF